MNLFPIMSYKIELIKEKKDIKKLKNVVAIGGFPGVGKSTLVNFFKKDGYIVSLEFDGSNLSNILLELLQHYFNNRYDGYIMQIGFINNSLNRYVNAVNKAKNNELVFIDRTIIENRFFAESQIANDFLKQLYNFEHAKKHDKLTKQIGLPSLYFHLTSSFEMAMKRLRARDKKEYDEKIKNKENFKKIYYFYCNILEKELKEMDIECITVDTMIMNASEVYRFCKNKLKAKKLI